jgi:hypothetical protein
MTSFRGELPEPAPGPGEVRVCVTLSGVNPGDIKKRAGSARRWRPRVQRIGARFLTPPVDRGAELRCYIRDPGGHLIEVGLATGLQAGAAA